MRSVIGEDLQFKFAESNLHRAVVAYVSTLPGKETTKPYHVIRTQLFSALTETDSLIATLKAEAHKSNQSSERLIGLLTFYHEMFDDLKLTSQKLVDLSFKTFASLNADFVKVVTNYVRLLSKIEEELDFIRSLLNSRKSEIFQNIGENKDELQGGIQKKLLKCFFSHNSKKFKNDCENLCRDKTPEEVFCRKTLLLFKHATLAVVFGLQFNLEELQETAQSLSNSETSELSGFLKFFLFKFLRFQYNSLSLNSKAAFKPILEISEKEFRIFDAKYSSKLYSDIVTILCNALVINYSSDIFGYVKNSALARRRTLNSIEAIKEFDLPETTAIFCSDLLAMLYEHSEMRLSDAENLILDIISNMNYFNEPLLVCWAISIASRGNYDWYTDEGLKYILSTFKTPTGTPQYGTILKKIESLDKKPIDIVKMLFNYADPICEESIEAFDGTINERIILKMSRNEDTDLLLYLPYFSTEQCNSDHQKYLNYCYYTALLRILPKNDNLKKLVEIKLDVMKKDLTYIHYKPDVRLVNFDTIDNDFFNANPKQLS